MNAAHAGTLKSPPYLVHSEKAVLGAILSEPSLIGEVRAIVRDGTVFFKDQHARVFALLVELDETHESFDLEMVIEAARGEGLVSDAVGTAAIDTLTAAAVSRSAALEHARQLRDKALMRELIDVVSDILYDASKSSDGFAEVLARSMAKLAALEEQITPAPPPPPRAPPPDRDPAAEPGRPAPSP